MSKIKLFIANSINGYIARLNGDLDWLDSFSNSETSEDHGYSEFIDTIDAILIGSRTYEKILSFGVDWPYSGCTTYVITRNAEYLTKTPSTHLLLDISKESIEGLKSKYEKDIWLMGGGVVITDFLNNDLVDEMLLSLIPIVLDEGIPLFPGFPKESRWDLVGNKKFQTGILNLHYVKK